jgi:GLPGLI family protein
MKISNCLLLFVAVLISCGAIAQKDKKNKAFEGFISYTVAPQGDIDPSVSAQLPTEIIAYYKGDKTRLEQKTAMGSAIIIGNMTTKEQIVLIDMMGQKMALKSTKEETEKAQAEIPKGTFTVGTETKTIAGYNCKKADFVQDGKTVTIYTTDEIDLQNSNWQTQFKDVTGVMLEYTQMAGQEGDIKLLITAKEVSKEKVKDAMFTVPTGYQEMSMAEFKKMFGGGQ